MLACLLACADGGEKPGPKPVNAAPETAVSAPPPPQRDPASEAPPTTPSPPPSPADKAVLPAVATLADLPLPSTSISIGHPSEGRLEGAAALPVKGEGYRFNSNRDSNARFGAAEVIGAIARAALHVDKTLPGSELVVNDISLKQGGPIDHHGSHRVGRDADILFYMLGDDGKPTPSVGAPIDPEGIGFDYKDLAVAEDDIRVHFDAPRTWRFLAALLSDHEAHVQRIFVVEHLRDKLLTEADKHPEDGEQRDRFAEMTCQPSYPHDDHLHVRWFCSTEDLGLGCEDLPPLYPWRSAQLKQAGVTPVMGVLRKSRPRSKIVTHEDEDRRVARQVIHRDVHAFLARRKTWREQPHPGRKYCK